MTRTEKAEARRKEIKKILSKKEIDVKELADHFGVSGCSIRQDLHALRMADGINRQDLARKRRKKVKRMVKQGKTKAQIIAATKAKRPVIDKDLQVLGLKTVDQIAREEKTAKNKARALELLRTTNMNNYAISKEADISIDIVVGLKNKHFNGLSRKEYEDYNKSLKLWDLVLFRKNYKREHSKSFK